MTVALHHSRATGLARLVLIGIANHDGDGGAWPTVATLAKYAGNVSERTVRRAIGELAELGEIVVHLNQGGDRNVRPDRRPNLYEVVLACPPECDGTRRHGVRQASPDGRTHVSARQVNGRTPVTEREDKTGTNGRTHVSAKTSYKPSIKGGEPNETTSPVDNSTLPPLQIESKEPNNIRQRPDRCMAHQDVDIAPPCGSCKDARIASERTAQEATAAREAQAALVASGPKCPEHSWRRASNCIDCAGEHKGGMHNGLPRSTCRLCGPLYQEATE